MLDPKPSGVRRNKRADLAAKLAPTNSRFHILTENLELRDFRQNENTTGITAFTLSFFKIKSTLGDWGPVFRKS